jgi:hypothetical protein
LATAPDAETEDELDTAVAADVAAAGADALAADSLSQQLQGLPADGEMQREQRKPSSRSSSTNSLCSLWETAQPLTLNYFAHAATAGQRTIAAAEAASRQATAAAGSTAAEPTAAGASRLYLQIQSFENHKNPQEILPHNATWAHQAAMHIQSSKLCCPGDSGPTSKGQPVARIMQQKSLRFLPI